MRFELRMSIEWLEPHRLTLFTVWVLLNTRISYFFENAGMHAVIGLLAYLTIASWDHTDPSVGMVRPVYGTLATRFGQLCLVYTCLTSHRPGHPRVLDVDK